MVWTEVIRNGRTTVSCGNLWEIRRNHFDFLLGCNRKNTESVNFCQSSTTLTPKIFPRTTKLPNIEKNASEVVLSPNHEKSVVEAVHQKSSAGLFTAVFSIFIAVFALVGWTVYAYTHPNTRSGYCLIQYGRPIAWLRRRNEAQYVAASFSS